MAAGGALTLTPYGVAAVQHEAPLWNVDAPVLTRFSVETGDDPVALPPPLDDHAAPGRAERAAAARFDEVGPERRLLVEQGWRTDDPAVLPVLDALGRNHPDQGNGEGRPQGGPASAPASPPRAPTG